jgi:hypothetical protein
LRGREYRKGKYEEFVFVETFNVNFAFFLVAGGTTGKMDFLFGQFLRMKKETREEGK